MFVISDIVNGWENFTSFANATEYLRNFGDEEIIVKYLKCINWLPLEFEDAITKFAQMSDEDMDLISNGIQQIKTNVIVSDKAEAGQCHKVAEALIKEDPTLRLFIGFAVYDNSCAAGRDWHYHSFCMNNKGEIIEPTPMVRDIYFGVEVPR